MRHLLSAVFAGALVAVTASSAVAAPTQALTRNPAEVRSGAYGLDPNHGKITWSVTHLGFSTYVGQFTGVKANLQLNVKDPSASTMDVSIDPASVGTLNKALDDMLKGANFLDVAKFPTATFKANKIALKEARTADIAGDLTLHGVTKPVTIKAVFNQAGTGLDPRYTVGFDGEVTIKRSDFGISYGVPAVSDEVTLHIEAEFKLLPSPTAAP